MERFPGISAWLCTISRSAQLLADLTRAHRNWASGSLKVITCGSSKALIWSGSLLDLYIYILMHKFRGMTGFELKYFLIVMCSLSGPWK